MRTIPPWTFDSHPRNATAGKGGSSEWSAQFHGFFGEYKLTAQEGGREISETFAFDASTPLSIEVKLE